MVQAEQKAREDVDTLRGKLAAARAGHKDMAEVQESLKLARAAAEAHEAELRQLQTRVQTHDARDADRCMPYSYEVFLTDEQTAFCGKPRWSLDPGPGLYLMTQQARWVACSGALRTTAAGLD